MLSITDVKDGIIPVSIYAYVEGGPTFLLGTASSRMSSRDGMRETTLCQDQEVHCCKDPGRLAASLSVDTAAREVACGVCSSGWAMPPSDLPMAANRWRNDIASV